MGTEDDKPTPPEPPATPPEPPADVTLSQTDLDKMIASRVAKAERAAASKFADDLGMSIADAQKMRDDAKAADDATKSEAEKARDEAVAAKAEADQARSEAKADRQAAKVERELAKRGLDAAAVSRVQRLIVLEDGDDDIEAAVDALADDLPTLFADSGDGKGSGSTVVKKRAVVKTSQVTSIDAGKAEAERRFGTPTQTPAA